MADREWCNCVWVHFRVLAHTGSMCKFSTGIIITSGRYIFRDRENSSILNSEKKIKIRIVFYQPIGEKERMRDRELERVMVVIKLL